MMRALSFIPLMIVALALAACATDRESSEAADGRVTILLNWFPEAEHGGFYAALVEGFYAEEGLDVEILPGGVDIPVVQMVDTNRATFGVTNADDVLIGRAQGAHLVALMAALQDSPRCIMVPADSAINDFDDLRNITLAMSSRATFSHFLRHHLPLEGVSIVGYPGNVAPLLAGRVDAMQAYNFSEPFVAQRQGMATRELMVSDLGYNPYTSLLVATEPTVRDHPDLVRRVVRASVRGWEHYLEQPEETNRHINSLNPEMGMDVLAFGVEMLDPLVRSGNAAEAGIGTMTADRWEELERQLVEINVIPQGSVVPGEAWTGEFLVE